MEWICVVPSRQPKRCDLFIAVSQVRRTTNSRHSIRPIKEKVGKATQQLGRGVEPFHPGAQKVNSLVDFVLGRHRTSKSQTQLIDLCISTLAGDIKSISEWLHRLLENPEGNGRSPQDPAKEGLEVPTELQGKLLVMHTDLWSKAANEWTEAWICRGSIPGEPVNVRRRVESRLEDPWIDGPVPVGTRGDPPVQNEHTP